MSATDRIIPKPRLSVDFQTLADLGVQRSYRRDAVIINEGEIGDTLFILIQGRARVFNTSLDGRELTLGSLTVGDFFGEMVLDSGPRAASVEAIEPCLCAVIPVNHVLDLMSKNSEFAIFLLQKTITRFRAFTQIAREFAMQGVYERFTQTLNQLAAAGHNENSLKIILPPISQCVFAEQVGTSREIIAKLMKELERRGYIQVNAQQITLLRKLPVKL